MINWRVRIKNKNFWMSIVPATLLMIQAVASAIGVEIDLGDMGNKILTVVNSVFAFLSILGVVNDPTTEGLSDSA